MDLATIRTALADELQGFDFNVCDIMATPVLPAIMIGLPDTIEYQGMKGCTITLPIQLVVSTGDPVEAQNQLSRALTARGPVESVLDRLRTARNAAWNGNMMVINVGNFNLAENLSNALMAEIVIQLWAN